MFKPTVFIVSGPTATGKTEMGVKLALEAQGKAQHKARGKSDNKKGNKTGNKGAVISADSRQIYIGMDIGTAKAVKRKLPTMTVKAVKRKLAPMTEQLPKRNDPTKTTEGLWQKPIKYKGVDHYLIDIVYPNERYTVFDFKRQAYALIEMLLAKKITPIIVGGTGLYINALLKNYEIESEKKEDLKLREKLSKEAIKIGKQKMWDKLKKVDPASAKRIHANNLRYILRALELHALTGLSSTKIAKKSKPPFKFKIIKTDLPRAEIYKNIEDRIDAQIREGLIEETKRLRVLYSPNAPAMSSLGYKEIGQYLDGKMTFDDAIAEFKKKTRHYAKRQIGWNKNMF